MLGGLWHYKDVVQAAALLVLMLLAMWRGGRPERLIAATFVAMYVIDRCYHQVTGAGYFAFGVNLGHLAIDLLAMAAFGAIALWANRVYPLWLAGLQLLALLSHPIRALVAGADHGAYAVLMIAPSYGQTMVFAIGLARHLQRRASLGRYQPWREA